jgi:hypothetical protein
MEKSTLIFIFIIVILAIIIVSIIVYFTMNSIPSLPPDIHHVRQVSIVNNPPTSLTAAETTLTPTESEPEQHTPSGSPRFTESITTPPGSPNTAEPELIPLVLSEPHTPPQTPDSESGSSSIRSVFAEPVPITVPEPSKTSRPSRPIVSEPVQEPVLQEIIPEPEELPQIPVQEPLEPLEPLEPVLQESTSQTLLQEPLELIPELPEPEEQHAEPVMPVMTATQEQQPPIMPSLLPGPIIIESPAILPETSAELPTETDSESHADAVPIQEPNTSATSSKKIKSSPQIFRF